MQTTSEKLKAEMELKQRKIANFQAARARVAAKNI
jgi:hypothetical protein